MKKNVNESVLNATKRDLKEIEHFVKSRPLPTEDELKEFLKDEKLTRYESYANPLLKAVIAKEWFIFNSRIRRNMP
jgi:hypothetical protein